MFCQKCGAANQNDSRFCHNCASPLVPVEQVTYEKKPSKKGLFSGHVVNIIAMVFLVAAFLFIRFAASNGTGDITTDKSVDGVHTSSTSTSVTFNTDGASAAYTAVGVGLVVAAVGLVVYFAADVSLKKALAWVYLMGSLVTTGLLIYGALACIAFTCGLSLLTVIAGILEISAGVKFLVALKDD